MKKKILAGIVNGLLVLSILSGCQKKEAAEAIDTTTATEEITASEEAQENTASEEAQILSVESLSAEHQNMLAVMDSLNMCMLENDWEYTPEDPAFLWTALFYTIGNYPNIRDNESTGAIKIDSYEGIMTVYYKLIQEYATGITETYEELPALPADCCVMQNADTEYYDFPMGDRGISYGKIASWTVNADGTNTVVTELRAADDESLIGAYEYTLVDNSYADGMADPMFAYTVRSATKLQAD